MRYAIYEHPPKKTTTVHIIRPKEDSTFCSKRVEDKHRVSRKPYGRPYCARCEYRAAMAGVL